MLTKTVVQHFGSPAAVARALEISSAAVAKWGETVPEGSAYKVESLTAGQIKVDPEFYRQLKKQRSVA